MATNDKKLVKHYEQEMKNVLKEYKVDATDPDKTFDPSLMEQVRCMDTKETAASHIVSQRPNHGEWFYTNNGQNGFNFAYPEILAVSFYLILHLSRRDFLI